MSTTEVALRDTVEIFGVQSVLRLCRLVRLVRIIKARKYVTHRGNRGDIILTFSATTHQKDTVGSCLLAMLAVTARPSD